MTKEQLFNQVSVEQIYKKFYSNYATGKNKSRSIKIDVPANGSGNIYHKRNGSKKRAYRPKNNT